MKEENKLIVLPETVTDDSDLFWWGTFGVNVEFEKIFDLTGDEKTDIAELAHEFDMLVSELSRVRYVWREYLPEKFSEDVQETWTDDVLDSYEVRARMSKKLKNILPESINESEEAMTMACDYCRVDESVLYPLVECVQTKAEKILGGDDSDTYYEHFELELMYETHFGNDNVSTEEKVKDMTSKFFLSRLYLLAISRYLIAYLHNNDTCELNSLGFGWAALVPVFEHIKQSLECKHIALDSVTSVTQIFDVLEI